MRLPESDPRRVLNKSRTTIGQMFQQEYLQGYQPFWCGTLSYSKIFEHHKVNFLPI